MPGWRRRVGLGKQAAIVLAGIKRKHARPPMQKEAILPGDILAMVAMWRLLRSSA